MTVHTVHLDTHEAGLFNDCPRCQEHAEHPLESLDYDNIRRLVEGRIYTRLDAYAAARLEDIAMKARRLSEIVG